MEKFVELFDKNADLIVTSSGGVIPQLYWNSYPYLNYDGDSHPSADKLYIETLVYRVDKFFRTHKYRHIVANFRPALRNTKPLKDLFVTLKDEGVIESFIFTPDEELYEDIKRRGFPSSKMFPDLDVKVLEVLKQEIGQPPVFDLF